MTIPASPIPRRPAASNPSNQRPTDPPASPPPSTPASDPTRDIKQLQALYRLFDHFALRDQQTYYKQAIHRYRRSAEQVNRLRAIAAFISGMASALAGLIVAVWLLPVVTPTNGACNLPSPEIAVMTEPPGYCGALMVATGVLTIIAIVAPAIGAAFTTLSDLYQWDRQLSIYEAAVENLAVADAQSPIDKMDALTYKASLRAFVEGSLTVMSDETAQWGQLIKTPPQLEKFIEDERRRAAQMNGDADAPDAVPGRTGPEGS